MPIDPLRATLLILKARLLWIAATGSACAVVAAMYLWAGSQKFEATASLTMAHVLGSPVEGPAVLVEKIKTGTYFSEAAWEVCGLSKSKDPGRQLASSLRPVSNKNAPFLGLSFTASTTNIAIACLAQVITEITLAQDKQAQLTLVPKRAQLGEMRQRLATIRESVLSAEKPQVASEINHQPFAVQSLWLSAAISRRAADRDLARRIADLEIRLTAPLTHPTRLISDIYAPPIPLGPPTWLVLLGAFLTGVLLSAGGFWLRFRWQSVSHDKLAG